MYGGDRVRYAVCTESGPQTLTSEPLLGSRPRKPGRAPPFRPDVPCVTQKPPDLDAATGPAPEQQQVSALPRRRRPR